MEKITQQELNELKANQTVICVDARSTSAYIGWLVGGATRRGHMPGAISIAASWLRFLDNTVLSQSERRFKEKLLLERVQDQQLALADAIVLYDSNQGEDANKVSRYLESIGIQPTHYFDFSQYEGALRTYPGFEHLVPAEWIWAVLQGEEPAYYDGLGLQIYECTWGPENITFLGSHIPTATHIDTDEFERQPEWIRKDDEDLIAAVEANGIDFGQTTVLYSNGSDGAEYKIAMLLRYLGHPKVKVLNGGYPAWRSIGLPTERGPVAKQALDPSKRNPYYVDNSIFINMDEAKDILAGKSEGQLVDGRTWDEYSAALTGYKYIEVSGRIPGSVWGGSYIDYKNIDDSIRSQEEVLALMADHQLHPHDKIAYFCGSAGWGASQIQFNADVYGENQLRTYEGGWNEWLLDSTNPIETDLLESEE